MGDYVTWVFSTTITLIANASCQHPSYSTRGVLSHGSTKLRTPTNDLQQWVSNDYEEEETGMKIHLC